MFLEILLAIALGVLAGIFTGLIPGVHVNLVAAICLSLTFSINPILLSVFILSMAITHTFVDAVPSIYLGAPDESMALAALPGHRMLLLGEGHNALKLTVIGSLFSLIFAMMISPLFFYVYPRLYVVVKDYIGYILIAIILLLAWKSGRVLSLVFFMISGVFGLIVLNIPNVDNVMLPLLSGLFGISLLVMSLGGDKIPGQKTSPLILDIKIAIKSITCGTFVASFASFLPGFGSSQSAIVAQSIVGDIGDKGFLMLVGGINTVNMALSLVTLHTIGKARNGAVLAVSEVLESVPVFAFLPVIVISGSFAAIITLQLSKIFQSIMQKVNYRMLVLCVILFVTLLVAALSGMIGLLILITGTAIGILATCYRIGKNNLMGCLILPVILYFI